MNAKSVGRTFVAAGAALLIAACASSPKQESTGEFLDDSVITTKVKTVFVEDEKVSALRIGVVTQKGIVQLSGFAKSPSEAERASSLARTVPGVKAVRNDIVVQ